MKTVWKYQERISELLIIVLMLSISCFVGLYELDFTNRDFDVLYTFGGDGISFCALVQSVRESGVKGLYFVERLGAPKISSYVEISSVDPLLLAWICGINIFTDSANATVLVYYVSTFMTASGCMYWLLRKLKMSSAISGVFGLLFSFAPYHFYRGLGHANLISIYTIPLGIAVAIYIVFCHTDDKTVTINFKKKEMIICSILVGFGCSYYFFFLLMMYAVAYISNLMLCKKKMIGAREFMVITLQKLCLPILSVICLILGQMPRIVYNKMIGQVGSAMERSWIESEIYALKIVQLFLPASYHNCEYLRRLNTAYSSIQTVNMNENQWSTLGFAASVGVIILLVMFFEGFVKKKKRFSIYDFFALSVVTYFLIACGGGFGEVFNMLVTPQFRCYNRVSIVLQALGIMTVAFMCQKFMMGRSAKCSIIVLSVILLVGVYDQIPKANTYDSDVAETQEVYEEFFSQIETDLGLSAMVYQLPYASFPENGAINEMADYAHFKAYLFTDTIRWSYGAVRGYDMVAEELLDNGGMSYLFVQNLLKAGFSGVYIDTTGYEDGGAEIVEFYSGLGISPIVSKDETLYFYNISCVEIDARKAKIGYVFVEDLMEICGISVDVELASAIADNLALNPEDATDEIYEIFEKAGIDEYSAAEYVSFLYENVLEREADVYGKDGWTTQIESGLSYKDVLYGFIISEEFKTNQLGEDCYEN